MTACWYSPLLGPSDRKRSRVQTQWCARWNSYRHSALMSLTWSQQLVTSGLLGCPLKREILFFLKNYQRQCGLQWGLDWLNIRQRDFYSMDVKLEDLIPKKMKQLQKKETRIRQQPAISWVLKPGHYSSVQCQIRGRKSPCVCKERDVNSAVTTLDKIRLLHFLQGHWNPSSKQCNDDKRGSCRDFSCPKLCWDIVSANGQRFPAPMVKR